MIQNIYSAGDVSFNGDHNSFTLTAEADRQMLNLLVYVRVDNNGNKFYSVVGLSDSRNNANVGYTYTYTPKTLLRTTLTEQNLNLQGSLNYSYLNHVETVSGSAISTPYNTFTDDRTLSNMVGGNVVTDGWFKLLSVAPARYYLGQPDSLQTGLLTNVDSIVPSAVLYLTDDNDILSGEPISKVDIDTEWKLPYYIYGDASENSLDMHTVRDCIVLPKAVSLIIDGHGNLNRVDYRNFRDKIETIPELVAVGDYYNAQMVIQSVERYLITMR